jgi:hypothetical protein
MGGAKAQKTDAIGGQQLLFATNHHWTSLSLKFKAFNSFTATGMYIRQLF